MSKLDSLLTSELGHSLWALRRGWFAVAAFSGLANLLMLAPTLYMMQVYDRVLLSGSVTTLIVVSLVTLFLVSLMALSERFRSLLLVRLGVRLDAALSDRVFNASFQANALQNSVHPSKPQSDLLELRQFLTGHGIIAFLDAPWAPIYLIVLFILHPLLGAVACLFGAFQAALAWWGHRQAVLPANRLQAAQMDSTGLLNQQLRHAEVAEPMGMWTGLQARWQAAHGRYLLSHSTSFGFSHRLSAWSKWLRYSQQSLSLAVGAWLVIHGEMTAGAMIAANVLMSKALAPIDQMVNVWRQWLSVQSAYKRLDDLLAKHPLQNSELKRVRPRGEIELVNVSAWSSGREAPLLDGIDLKLSAGSMTVVLGPSGSGKSTLARVLLGIGPQIQGKVLLDGASIDSWDRQELGPFIGYLPQEVQLFSGSIAQNIARFGGLDAPAVVSAAEKTGLHNTILRMPQGYDTPAGDAGDRLSGGQRQRIGLARALYGEPALVVLDEPNAHLDDAGEQALGQAVLAMKQKGQTVVLITHRPSIVALADTVVLLQAGRIQWHLPRNEAMQTLPVLRRSGTEK